MPNSKNSIVPLKDHNDENHIHKKINSGMDEGLLRGVGSSALEAHVY